MAVERNESIDKDKLKELLEIDWITKKELTQEEIKEISKNFSVQDLYPIAVALNNPHQKIDWVKWSREKLGMNILSLLSQCNENEKEALSEENQRKVEEQQKEIDRIQSEKAEDEKNKQKDIAALKKLLDYDDKDNSRENNENVNSILEVVAINNKNRTVLDQIKQLQNDLDGATDLADIDRINKELAKKKLELKWLLWQKDDLYYKYFWERYDDDHWRWIQEFKRWWKVFGKWINEETWQTVRGVMSPLRPKRIARRRLNRVIRQMNKIKDDSTAWMKMVMNRCYLNWLRPIRRWMKSVANTFRLKNPAEFSAKYDKQANEFIRDLTKKLETAWKLSGEDKKTIALIEKRLKRYKEDYKRQFLQM